MIIHKLGINIKNILNFRSNNQLKILVFYNIMSIKYGENQKEGTRPEWSTKIIKTDANGAIH